MKKSYMSLVPNIVGDQNETNKYRKNLMKVEVYYEEFNYEKVSEKAAYGVSSSSALLL